MQIVWKFVIRPEPDEPDEAQGYVLAKDEAEALGLVNDPAAQVFPYPEKVWPGSTGTVTLRL